jgi:hypothetical protein
MAMLPSTLMPGPGLRSNGAWENPECSSVGPHSAGDFAGLFAQWEPQSGSGGFNPGSFGPGPIGPWGSGPTGGHSGHDGCGGSQGQGGTSVNDLLGTVKDVKNSSEKYGLIKEAIYRMEQQNPGGGVSGQQWQGGMSGAPSSSGGPQGCRGHHGGIPGGEGNTSGSPQGYNRLLNTIGSLAREVSGAQGLGQSAKSEILNDIAGVLKSLNASTTQQGATNPKGPPQGGGMTPFNPTNARILSAINSINNQVQHTLPDGSTKSQVQNMLADILQDFNSASQHGPVPKSSQPTIG